MSWMTRFFERRRRSTREEGASAEEKLLSMEGSSGRLGIEQERYHRIESDRRLDKKIKSSFRMGLVIGVIVGAIVSVATAAY